MTATRSYRRLAHRKGLVSFRVAVKETDLFVHARSPLEGVTRELILEQRGYLEGFIDRHPRFAATLRPWRWDGPMPAIVRDMVSAGRRAGVGPMAAVAGAIAEHVGAGLLAHTDEVIVENGGDVYLKLNGPFTTGIFAGRSPLSMRVGIRLDPAGGPLAVCTSSGTIGHSLSLGKADAVCVISTVCAAADAAATAVGNHVASAADIPEAISFGKRIQGVTGLVVIVGDRIGIWGDLSVVPLGEKRG